MNSIVLKLVVIFSTVWAIGCAPFGISDAISGASGEDDIPSIVVPTDGTIIINWIAPNKREDGNVLLVSELSGYKLYYTDRNDVDAIDSDTFIFIPETGELPLSQKREYTLEGLLEGDYYFTLKAVDTDSLESKYSIPLVFVIVN